MIPVVNSLEKTRQDRVNSSFTFRLFWISCATLFCIGGIALVRDTAYNGQDFAVFWRTAKHILEGQAPYSVARDGAMVFKYPPWIAPFFFPLTLLSFDQARWVWGAVEVTSLGLVLLWLFKQGVHKTVLALVTISFWGIWAVHALDGQVVLPVLCAALWLWNRTSFLVYALTTKVFTVFPLAGKASELKDIRKLFSILILLGIFSLPAIWSTQGHNPLRMLAEWAEAAGSGAAQFGSEKIRGPENQSLVALVMRLLEVPSLTGQADLLAFLLFATLFGAIWHRLSRHLSPTSRQLGWLALTPVVHPLPWFHLFAFSFPLAAFTLDLSLKKKCGQGFALSLIGILSVAIITGKTFGTVGTQLELAAIKSWGTLLLVGALTLTSYKKKSHFDSALSESASSKSSSQI
jgi:hypothetical protein